MQPQTYGKQTVLANVGVFAGDMSPALPSFAAECIILVHRMTNRHLACGDCCVQYKQDCLHEDAHHYMLLTTYHTK